MANLEIALKKVLGWEGGFANDPDDSGGPTMKGVTIATYKEYCRRKGKKTPTVEDLKRITNEEILDLADLLYWSKIQGDNIKNQSIANLCFDCVWGSGTGYIKVIQKVLGVTADGIFGPMSLRTLNEWDPQAQLFQMLWDRRKIYLSSCSGAWKYLKGWLRRLNSFTFEPSPFEDKDPSQLEEGSTTQIEETKPVVVENKEEIPTTINEQVLEEKKVTWLQTLLEWIKKIFQLA